MFQAPAPLRKARHLFDCVSFTVYRSPYCHTVLNADGRVHTVLCVRLFYLFPHICASLFFLLPLVPSFFFFFFFFIAIFLYSYMYAHLFYLLSPSTLFFYKLLRTRLSPCLFQFSFVLIFAQRQASYNSYTSLLTHSSCYHAYDVHFGMVSS